MSRSLRALALTLFTLSAIRASAVDPRLKDAYKKPEVNGWIFVHLTGSPSEIGYQHGYFLTSDIEDAKRAIELSATHEVNHPWSDLRHVSRTILWPHIPAEYQQELQGIVAGLQAHGSKLDLDDIVAMNAFMEFPYVYDKPGNSAGEHCSAFIATGEYTASGKIVVGHNNWSDYLSGSRWKVIFDITPATGHHFIMDGVPGLIHSGDDFGMNDAGIVITETTISNFHGFDPAGTAEFARARKAMQYSESIDDFARIMKAGNNGGYANTWLIGDTKVNEIARLELGLKNVNLDRTNSGYFVGSNFPINADLIAQETDWPVKDKETPDNVRHMRWDELMAQYKGKIDVAAGEKFETDHYDELTKEIDPNERTLCGHIDKSRRGMPGWQQPFGPAGAVEAKVADANMIEHLSFEAGAGHPCGVAFHAAQFLQAHKQFKWQKSELQDLDAHPWTYVQAGRGLGEPAQPTPGN